MNTENNANMDLDTDTSANDFLFFCQLILAIYNTDKSGINMLRDGVRGWSIVEPSADIGKLVPMTTTIFFPCLKCSVDGSKSNVLKNCVTII